MIRYMIEVAALQAPMTDSYTIPRRMQEMARGRTEKLVATEMRAIRNFSSAV